MLITAELHTMQLHDNNVRLLRCFKSLYRPSRRALFNNTTTIHKVNIVTTLCTVACWSACQLMIVRVPVRVSEMSSLCSGVMGAKAYLSASKMGLHHNMCNQSVCIFSPHKSRDLTKGARIWYGVTCHRHAQSLYTHINIKLYALTMIHDSPTECLAPHTWYS